MEDLFTFHYEEKDICIEVSLFLVFEKKDKENAVIDLESASSFIESEIFERIKNGKQRGYVDFTFNDVCYSGNWDSQ